MRVATRWRAGRRDLESSLVTTIILLLVAGAFGDVQWQDLSRATLLEEQQVALASPDSASTDPLLQGKPSLIWESGEGSGDAILAINTPEDVEGDVAEATKAKGKQEQLAGEETGATLGSSESRSQLREDSDSDSPILSVIPDEAQDDSPDELFDAKDLPTSQLSDNNTNHEERDRQRAPDSLPGDTAKSESGASSSAALETTTLPTFSSEMMSALVADVPKSLTFPTKQRLPVVRVPPSGTVLPLFSMTAPDLSRGASSLTGVTLVTPPGDEVRTATSFNGHALAVTSQMDDELETVTSLADEEISTVLLLADDELRTVTYATEAPPASGTSPWEPMPSFSTTLAATPRKGSRHSDPKIGAVLSSILSIIGSRVGVRGGSAVAGRPGGGRPPARINSRGPPHFVVAVSNPAGGPAWPPQPVAPPETRRRPVAPPETPQRPAVSIGHTVRTGVTGVGDGPVVTPVAAPTVTPDTAPLPDRKRVVTTEPSPQTSSASLPSTPPMPDRDRMPSNRSPVPARTTAPTRPPPGHSAQARVSSAAASHSTSSVPVLTRSSASTSSSTSPAPSPSSTVTPVPPSSHEDNSTASPPDSAEVRPALPTAAPPTESPQSLTTSGPTGFTSSELTNLVPSGTTTANAVGPTLDIGLEVGYPTPPAATISSRVDQTTLEPFTSLTIGTSSDTTQIISATTDTISEISGSILDTTEAVPALTEIAPETTVPTPSETGAAFEVPSPTPADEEQLVSTYHGPTTPSTAAATGLSGVPLQQPVTPANQPTTPSQRPVTPSERPVTLPEQPVTLPERPVTLPEQPVTLSERPITLPERPVTLPERPVTLPEWPVTLPERPVTLPEQPVTLPERLVTLPDRPVTLPEQSVTREEQPVTPAEEVVIPAEQPVTPLQQSAAPETPVPTPERASTSTPRPEPRRKPADVITSQYVTPSEYPVTSAGALRTPPLAPVMAGRPGLVLDATAPQRPHGVSGRPEVFAVIATPPGVGEVLDVTVSATQGFGVGSNPPTSRPYIPTGQPYVIPVDINELRQPGDIITKPDHTNNFVSIDGRRTYFNLAPTDVVKRRGSFQTIGAGVDFSGGGRPTQPRGTPPPWRQRPSSASHPGGARRPQRPGSVYPGHGRRPSPPPVRIDTCIVGDDSTCKGHFKERCRTEGGVSSCVCRPGYSRLRPRTICKRVVSVVMSVKVDGVDDRKLSWSSDFSDPESEAFQQLAWDARNAINSAMTQTAMKDVYMGNDVTSFYSLGGRLILNTTVMLLDTAQTRGRQVKQELQREMIRVIKAKDNNIGDSTLFVEGPLNPIPGIQDLNECSVPSLHDCDEHAECRNVFGSFLCRCRAGYNDRHRSDVARAGRHCESCTDSYCSAHGTCQINNGHKTCICRASYYGDRCDIDGEVLGAALGATAAAALIIIATFVGLCKWSKYWHKSQRGGKIEHGTLTAGNTFSYVKPGQQASLGRDERRHWAHMHQRMGHQQNIYAPEPMFSAAVHQQEVLYPGPPRSLLANFSSQAGRGVCPASDHQPASLGPAANRAAVAAQARRSMTPVPLGERAPPSRASRTSVPPVERAAPSRGSRTPVPLPDYDDDHEDARSRAGYPPPRPRSRGSVANQSLVYYDIHDFEQRETLRSTRGLPTQPISTYSSRTSNYFR